MVHYIFSNDTFTINLLNISLSIFAKKKFFNCIIYIYQQILLEITLLLKHIL